MGCGGLEKGCPPNVVIMYQGVPGSTNVAIYIYIYVAPGVVLERAAGLNAATIQTCSAYGVASQACKLVIIIACTLHTCCATCARNCIIHPPKTDAVSNYHMLTCSVPWHYLVIL
jgi:hypothetical protein